MFVYLESHGKSIVSPPSHCACGKPITVRQYSYIGMVLLRGRARCCGSKISFRYPLVEALTAFVFWVCGACSQLLALVGMFLPHLWFLRVCRYRYYDFVGFCYCGGTVLGFLISILLPGLHGIDVGGAPYFVSMVASAVSSAVGIAVGSGIVYWIRLLGECVFGREAMGKAT
ncbi:MAG: prepilin peptidase [Bacilli bacterium]